MRQPNRSRLVTASLAAAFAFFSLWLVSLWGAELFPRLVAMSPANQTLLRTACLLLAAVALATAAWTRHRRRGPADDPP